jgi:hypothetical protein
MLPPAVRSASAESHGSGLVVARRGFFGTVAAACAAAGLPGSRTSWQDRQGEGDWTVEQFVREVTPICRELVADRSARGQDRYLLVLASQAVRLGPVPDPKGREVAKGYRIGSHHGPDPFTVLHWQLEPGAIVRPHPHIYGNVVTLGLRGSALVENYEVHGARDYDRTEPFVVQRTHEQVLRPGDVNLVSLERSYVHGFVAGPEGAEGLDITTRIAEKRPSPVLELGDAVDRAARTFHGRWRHGD